MNYAEYQLIDLGYDDPATDPIEHRIDIEGRDNVTQCFTHNGYNGYPEGARLLVDTSDNSKTLGFFEGTPTEGGINIDADDVQALLISDYNYPAETSIGKNGLPVLPQEIILIDKQKG